MLGSQASHASYRLIPLGLAALSSFISATWTAVAFLPSPTSHKYAAFLIRNNYWALQWAYIDLHRYALSIIALDYGTFLLIFVPTVILEWRLDIQIPLRAEYTRFGLACCAQIVAITLERISTPNESICSMQDSPWNPVYTLYAQIGRSFCSNWSAAFATSIISLLALAIYLVFPIITHALAIIRIVLSEHLREHNSPETPCEEPLLPQYSARPVENFEVQVLDESAIGPEDSIVFDPSSRTLAPVVVHKFQGSPKKPQKDGYEMLPSEDPARGANGL
ncbi:unnamed protein product, partial [Rhizoctonia solani]